jgi:hypothetical protein
MMTATRPSKHERKTERRFDRLPASYLVRLDVHAPGAPGAVDHVVLGATGVFTVKSRSFDHAVFIRGADIRSNGHYLEEVIDHARSESAAVAALLDVEVRPVVVVHGSRLTITGIFTTPVVRGVRFCEANKLERVLTTPPCVLTPEAVGHLAARLDA